MSKSNAGLNRPKRWDFAFSDEMSDQLVDRIMQMAPFRDMDPEGFPRSAQLPDILKNDARLRVFEPGEIVVRQGY